MGKENQIEKACFEKKIDQNTLFLYSIESSFYKKVW